MFSPGENLRKNELFGEWHEFAFRELISPQRALRVDQPIYRGAGTSEKQICLRLPSSDTGETSLNNRAEGKTQTPASAQIS